MGQRGFTYMKVKKNYAVVFSHTQISPVFGVGFPLSAVLILS